MLKIKDAVNEKIVNCKEGVIEFCENNRDTICIVTGMILGATASFVGFTIGHNHGVKNYKLALYNKIIEETINATTK